MNIKALNGTLGASRPRMILKIDPEISTVIEQIIDASVVKFGFGKKTHGVQWTGKESGRSAR